MRFSRIKVSESGVELDWTTVDGSGTTIEHALVDPAKPIPTFRQAMQAFSGWACDLIGAAPWAEDLRVTTLHLSEDANHRRGLKLTVLRKIERAHNQPIVINTPLMHEGQNGEEGAGIYGELLAGFIATAESEATRFVNGEREQGEIFAKDEEKPDIAPAGRKTKKSRAAGTPNEVLNADKSVAPTDDALRQVLLRAERDVPVDAIAHWNSQERDSAQRWATAVIEGVLNQKPTTIAEPDCVKRSATLPLSAEEWNEPNPLAGKAKDAQPIAAR